MRRISTIAGALIASAIGPGALAEPVNPFAHPVLESPVVAGVVPELASIGRPQLRGVIVAQKRSIANLSGTLLALGEEVAGYQLESVTDYSATFVHEGALITLYLEGEQPESVE